MSIAPQYTTFGAQKHKDGSKCNLADYYIGNSQTDAHTTKNNIGFGCQMTSIANIYNKIFLSMPMFSILYFILSWTFIIFFLVFLIYHGTNRSEKHASLSSFAEEDDEDLRSFITRQPSDTNSNNDDDY